MNIILQYRYLSKPLLVGILLYSISTNIFRYVAYLFMILHLASETYQAFGYKSQMENLVYLSKFWILFSALLFFDFTMELVFGHIPFPMLTNVVRLAYLLWLTYEPSSVISTYDYVAPYISVLSNGYNTFLLYAFALLY